VAVAVPAHHLAAVLGTATATATAKGTIRSQVERWKQSRRKACLPIQQKREKGKTANWMVRPQARRARWSRSKK
jgi:hypothetical protein